MPSYNNDISLYIQSIGDYPLVTPEEEIMLAAKIAKGDNDARVKLICSNLRLVVKIAYDFKGLGLPLLDLISEGNIGLMHAVDKFDPSKGAKLASYAAWWIKQSMRRALANQARTIRIPVQSASKICKIQAAKVKLSEQLGRDPTDKEIADEVKLTERMVTGLRLGKTTTLSLHDPIQYGEFWDIIPDNKSTAPNEIVQDEEIMYHVLLLTEKLDIRERRILELRFGLNGESPKTLEEISQSVGRTIKRVQQIEMHALEKLRNLLEEDGMLDREDLGEFDDKKNDGEENKDEEEFDEINNRISDFEQSGENSQSSSMRLGIEPSITGYDISCSGSQGVSNMNYIHSKESEDNTTINSIARQICGCLTDRPRIKSIFSDWLKSNNLPISLLMSSYDLGIIQILCKSGYNNNTILKLRELLTNLTNNYGVSEQTALWAIETWRIILGVSSATISLEVFNDAKNMLVLESQNSLQNNTLSPTNTCSGIPQAVLDKLLEEDDYIDFSLSEQGKYYVIRNPSNEQKADISCDTLIIRHHYNDYTLTLGIPRKKALYKRQLCSYLYSDQGLFMNKDFSFPDFDHYQWRLSNYNFPKGKFTKPFFIRLLFDVD